MNNFSLINPHFFQPLLPNFQSNFSIPKSFLKYLREEDKEEGDEKIAKIRNYEVGDYLWKVKVGYFDDKLHFKDGWNNFCNDHGLQVGDFLVFQYHQNLVFDVFVFDPTTCERPFPGLHHLTVEKALSSSLNNQEIKGFCKNGKELKRNKKHKAHPAGKASFEPRGYPYYETFVKSFTLKWGGVSVPSQFARENDLVNKWCDVTLTDQQGKEWQVTLRNRNQGRTVYIGTWNAFHRAHGLKTGDHIVFELIQSGETPKMNFYK
ncbi:B3 domain-containing protein REM14 [Spinacia oleracea]|uniref:B3 domain-containing protein REM14 n=1 Tax=Spinacia oleracea TaxID=3562 RepID=A0ABM3RNK0_SPIOL|nr:B3 domain-containing protein REM14-like [Spinacia oleracea]